MSGFDSDYLQDWLPEIYRDTPVSGLLSIIGTLFDDIHATIDTLPDRLAPQSPFYKDQTTEKQQFLQWFSGWVNLVLSEDWSYDEQRKMLAEILPLYKKRGTREGLQRYIEIYASNKPEILDESSPIQLGNKDCSIIGHNMIIGGFPPEMPALQVGGVSQIGQDTIIGGFPPYYFLVRAKITESGPKALRKKRKAIIDILDMEKPAHTWYRLTVKGPTFKLADDFKNATSTIGIDTII